MRLFADVIVNGSYKKISAYRVKEDLKEGITYWNDKVFLSTHKNRENKDVLVFENKDIPYFDGSKKVIYNTYIENIYEQMSHELYKEALADLDKIVFQINDTIIKIVIEHVEIDSFLSIDDEYVAVDVMISFSESEPIDYVTNWGGRLAVRIFVNQEISDIEKERFEKVDLALFESHVSKEHQICIETEISNQKIRALYEEIKELLSKELQGTLLVNPKPVAGKQTQIEKIQNLIERNAHKRTQIEDLNFKLHQKNMTIKAMEQKLEAKINHVDRLTKEVIQGEETIHRLNQLLVDPISINETMLPKKGKNSIFKRRDKE